MKSIIAILLISLLGLLGCSGSDDGLSTFTGQANPVAPFGIIHTPTPTYEWTPVPWATKYRLMVQDTNQASDTSETAVIDEWYTAEEAGCASEDGLCMATPDIEVFDENTWKVQACETQECGQWSESINFDVSADSGTRFIVHGDATVTDLNTGLIWSQNANLYGPQWWVNAHPCCDDMVWHGIRGWRLPSLRELRTLYDDSYPWPHMPIDHPFLNFPPGWESWLGNWTSDGCKTFSNNQGYMQLNFALHEDPLRPERLPIYCRGINWEPFELWDVRGFVWCVRDGPH